MKKKWLLGIILVITVLAIGIILLFTINTKYKKLVISEKEYNEIISSRNLSTSISLDNIKFNDYNLLIDDENSIVYYSVINTSTKYNPEIQYDTNEDHIKIAFSSIITDDVVEKENQIKIILYNDQSYKVYDLFVTNYPIINIITNDENENATKDIELELFDNNVAAPMKTLNSKGKLKVIEEDKEYILALSKESPGNNKRDNYISLFGMPKQNEYLILKKEEKANHKSFMFFINNESKGIYSIILQERRNHSEFIKENNK